MKNVQISRRNACSNFKNKKGITLIALVITIIVLLILAGVSILAITGENGILKRASSATENYSSAKLNEEAEITQYTNEIENYIGNARDDKYETFRKRIIDTLKGKNVNITNENSDDELINAINNMGNKQLILISENLSSRYNQTINIDTKYEKYSDLTGDNFIIVNKQLNWVGSSDQEDITTMTKTYDPSTGILSLGKQKSYTSRSGVTYTFWNVYDVYLYI